MNKIKLAIISSILILMGTGINNAYAAIALEATGLGTTGSASAKSMQSGTLDCSGANFIVLTVANYGLNATSDTVSDTSGNTYTSLTQQVGGNRHEAIWYAYNATGSPSLQITVSNNSSDYMSFVSACFSGVLSSSNPIDTQSGSVLSASGGLSNSTGPITPSQNNELVVTGVMNNNGSFWSVNSPLIKEVSTPNEDAKVYLADSIQTSASNVNAAWTFTGNSDTMPMSIASFQAQPVPDGVPVITAQPLGQTVNLGQTATYSVAAAGQAPLSYQWNKNGTPIAGATTASYTTPPTVSGDNGSIFTVAATNAVGTVTSNAVSLTINSNAAAIVRLATGTGTTGSISAKTMQSGSMNCAGANFIVLTAGNYVNDATTDVISDTAGNTYTALNQQTGNYRNEVLWYAYNATGSPTLQITISNTTSDYMSFAAACYSGVLASGPIDMQNGSVLESGGGLTNSTGPITPSQDNKLIVTGVMNDNGKYSSVNSPLNMEASTPSQSAKVYLADSIQTNASNANAAWVFTGSNDTMPMSIASFKVQTVPNVAPVITTQPINAAVTAPATATFTVAAAGVPAPSYQWMQSVDGGGSMNYPAAS